MLHRMKPVRIGVAIDPPWNHECLVDYPTRCPNPGMDIEYLYSVLGEILHLNVTFSRHESYENVLNALNDSVIDMIGNAFAIYDRPDIKNIHRTSIYMYEEIGFITKSVNSAPTLNIFTAFTLDLWICLTVISHVMYGLKSFLDKPRLHLSRKLSQFIYGIWFLILLFIIELYGNLLVDNLITASNSSNNLFTDLNDLSKKLIHRQCRFVLFENYTVMYKNVFAGQNKSWTESFLLSLHSNSITVNSSKEVYNTVINNASCLVGLDFVFHQTEFPIKVGGIAVQTFPSEIPIIPFVFYHTIQLLVVILDNIFATEPFSKFDDVLIKKYINDFQSECLKTSSMSSQISLSNMQMFFIVWISSMFLIFLLHFLVSVLKKRLAHFH